MKQLLITLSLLVSCGLGFSQGLEDIIVETYYISDANDATDTDGGELVEGSVTYRIYVDMLPGYEVQAVYGNENHTLNIATSTYFFNNEDRGEETGDAIGDNRLDENTVPLDSWITLGAASESHLGVLKTLDPDGSIVGGDNNDGGSEGITGGLLANEDPGAGIPLTNSDGLVDGTLPSGVVTVGVDASVFADANDGPLFTVTGGAWSVLEGVQGPTAENQVLIAQITTDGDFSFELNVQVGTPDGGTERYVASNPINDEIFFAALTFPEAAIPGCLDPEACNYNPDANDDDGSCNVPVENCSICNGDELEIIDTDGDGVCDAEEVLGCTSDTACNFDPAATEEDGSCNEPITDCYICNGDDLEIVDDDGDGVPNCEEIPGCSADPTACNYNPDATDEEACIVPIPNCAECNANGDGLILIDSDGDGICDADEQPECPGDFDGDFVVATSDLLTLLTEFGCSENCNYSLDGDEIVGVSDLLAFLSLFGTVCPQ